MTKVVKNRGNLLLNGLKAVVNIVLAKNSFLLNHFQLIIFFLLI